MKLFIEQCTFCKYRSTCIAVCCYLYPACQSCSAPQQHMACCSSTVGSAIPPDVMLLQTGTSQWMALCFAQVLVLYAYPAQGARSALPNMPQQRAVLHPEGV